VDPRSDRAGYRLTGAGLDGVVSADARSEPTCVGAVQLTPDGTLIVLMADGPTVGGYPKIAVVTTADLPRLAQLGPGARIALALVDAGEALAALRGQDAILTVP
jgi:allophanate hydrolase subunit 2